MPGTEIAVVTGGGSGIGRAAGIALAAAGWHVVFAGRTASSLDESVSLAGSGSSHVLDVTDRAAVDALFDGLERVDVVVNSAGIFGRQNPVARTSDEDWDASLSINVTGSFYTARAAFRRMVSQDPRGGRILNLGSVSAQVPRPEATPYTVSKHAVSGLTKSLALEGRDLDIAVGQLDVGNAATSMTQSFQVGALQPDGSRRVEPTMDVQHVADTIVFLARLPLSVNVPFMTVMATAMPLLGRG